MTVLSPRARDLIASKYVERMLTGGFGLGANSDPALVEIVRLLEEAGEIEQRKGQDRTGQDPAFGGVKKP